MEIKRIMDEIQWYMHEIVSLYETPPTPPISLTSLVKAWEVINFLTLESTFQQSQSYDDLNNYETIDKRLQARFMFIIVREFFKIKNERPEEYIENYENALKLLHLQK